MNISYSKYCVDNIMPIIKSYANCPVNVCLRSLEYLHQCWEDNI